MYVLLGRCTGIPRQSCMLQQNGVWGVLVASCELPSGSQWGNED
jgi:hypothetical protein